MAGRPPGLVDGPDGLGDLPPAQLGHHEPAVGGVDVIDLRIDLAADGLEGEVRDHANHFGGRNRGKLPGGARRAPASPADGLADGLLRALEPQPPHAGLVEHDGRLVDAALAHALEHHVLATVGIEQAAGQRLQAVHLEESDVDGTQVHRHLRMPGLHGEVRRYPSGHHLAAGAGDLLHPRQGGDLLLQSRLAGRRDPEHLIGVEPHGVVQGEACLPKDRSGHDDQADQDRELDDDQHLADRDRAGPLPHAALQRQGGPEAGDDQGRVGAGQ